jgi:carboxyl-terminal processing protease
MTIQKFYRPSGSSTQMDGVASDIVVPSIADALDIGEAFLDHALPHDRIRPSPNFKPLDPLGLFIPRLKELSTERINASKDFAYVIEDVMKTKARIKANKLMINKEAREKELQVSDRMQKERNAERRARFDRIAQEDKNAFTFFNIKLEDVDKVGPLKPFDPGAENDSYMRRAQDQTADLDETPKWPTNLDPLKRESIAVLKDLVDLTENARLAGLLKGTAGAH